MRIRNVIAVTVLIVINPLNHSLLCANAATTSDPLESHSVLVTTYDESKSEVKVCTGEIINENTVATSAHCVFTVLNSENNYTTVPLSIELMRIYFEDSIKSRNIDSFSKITESQLNSMTVQKISFMSQTTTGSSSVAIPFPTSFHDIALLRIAGPLPKGYSPAPLSNKDFKSIEIGTLLKAVGFSSIQSPSSKEEVLTKMVKEEYFAAGGSSNNGSFLGMSGDEIMPGYSGGGVYILDLDDGTWKLLAIIKGQMPKQAIEEGMENPSKYSEKDMLNTAIPIQPYLKTLLEKLVQD